MLDVSALEREPADAFDALSMIKVIEHLPDRHAPLVLAARLLNPGGLSLLTTGNLGRPAARRRRIRDRYSAPAIPVSLFDPRSLARL